MFSTLKRKFNEVDNSNNKRWKIKTKCNKNNFFENKCENFLKKNNIPFKRGVKLLEEIEVSSSKFCDITEFDFIIPFGIIELKSCPIDCDFFQKWETHFYKQIHTHFMHIPSNFKSYILLNSKELTEKVRNEVEKISALYNNRLIILNSINDLPLIKVPVFVKDIRIIRTFASNDLQVDEYNNYIKTYPKILIKKDVYNRAICIMNPDELERLNKFIFEFYDRFDDSVGYIELIGKQYSCTRSDDDNELFNIFQHYIPTLLLSNRRIIKMEFDGVTKKCNRCNYINFIERLDKDGICQHCIKQSSKDIIQ